MNKNSIVDSSRKQKDTIVLVIVVTILAVIALGYWIAIGSWMMVGLLGMLVLGFLVISRFELSLYLLVFLAVIQPAYIENFFIDIPFIFNWIPNILLIIVLFSLYFSGGIIHVPKPIRRIIAVLVVATVLSSIANLVVPWVAIMGVMLFVPLLGSCILFCSIDKRWINKLQGILLALGYLQVLVIILQRFVLHFRPDMIAGTFTSGGPAVFFLIYCILYTIDAWYRKELSMAASSIRIVPYVAAIALTGVAAGLLYLMIGVVWLVLQYFVGKSSRRNRYVGTILILGLLIVGVTGGIFLFERMFRSDYGYSVIEKLGSPEALIEYNLGASVSNFDSQLAKEGALRRGSVIVFTYNLLRHDWLTMILGVGPGNFSEMGPVFIRGHYYFLYPTLKLAQSTLSTTFGEYGLAGLILLIWIGVVFYYPKPYSIDPSHQSYLLLLRAMVVVTASMLIYYRVFLVFPAALILGMLNSYQVCPDYASRNEFI